MATQMNKKRKVIVRGRRAQQAKAINFKDGYI